MRKLIITITLACGIAVSGCSTLNPGTATFLGEVQALAAQACKFVPAISTIVAIFNAGIAVTVGGIATTICAALPPPASAQMQKLHRYGAGPAVTVSNVGTIPITGWRTP